MNNQKIVGVKYEDEYAFKTFNGRIYSYYTSLPLAVGDIVEAPTKNGISIARVARIDIPEEEVSSFKDILKTITVKLDKNSFLLKNELRAVV